VNPSGFFLSRERAAVAAAAEVIVVRPDRHPRFTDARHVHRRRQVGDDVVSGLLFAGDPRVQRQRQVGQCEAGDVRIRRVERLLDGADRLVRHDGEHRSRDRATDARGGDARAGERRVEAHRHRFARVGRARACEDDDRFRPAQTSGERFVPEVGVPGENRARLQVGVFREIAQDHDDLVLHVQAGVAVVVQALPVGDGDPVTREDNRTGDVAVVGKG
jgi:hypothetical protein